MSVIMSEIDAYRIQQIVDNGNAELLGYWFLTYDAVPENLGFTEGDAKPRLDLAFSDKDGIVNVVDPVNDPNKIPSEHFPLCSVLHNITTRGGGPGTFNLDFFGNQTTTMQDMVEFILGGKFNIATAFADGSPLVYDEVFGTTFGGNHAPDAGNRR